MVCSPHIPCIHLSHFPRRACICHIVSIVLSIKVPGIAHHQVKVCIIVNVSWNVGVIFYELIQGNLAITLGPMHNVMVHLKSLKEVYHHLICSLFAWEDVWVPRGVIDISQVFNIDDPWTIAVNLLKSFSNEGGPLWIHISSNNTDKLIIVYSTISIEVEGIENSINFV